MPKKNSEEAKVLRARISEAAEGLQYGQIVIVIKEGRVTQIEKTEKQRFPSLVGINGDGI